MLHTWKLTWNLRQASWKRNHIYKPPLLLAFQPSFFRGVVVFRESVDSIIFYHFMFFFLQTIPGFSGLIALRFFYVAWQNLKPKSTRRWVREEMTWWFLLRIRSDGIITIFHHHLGYTPENWHGYPKWWALEKVVPAINMAIFGIYVKFLRGSYFWNFFQASNKQIQDDRSLKA